jgi:carboxyl-terminal processing protease
MRKQNRAIRTLLISVLISVAISGAWCQENKGALLQETLEAGIARFKMPGAIAGLWFPGKGEWVGTAGIGNPTTGMKPGMNDRVRIGSITKSFTATLVLQLVDDGLLSLDDPLSRWVPEVPDAEGITVRHLLNMTSGFFNFTDLPEFWEEYQKDPFVPWAPWRMVEMALAHPALFEPGTQFMYCNTNYILLGIIIEKATGRTVAEEMTTRIINRLGLENTSFPMTPEIGEPYMRGYVPAEGEEDGSDKIVDFSICTPTPYWTAGAMVGTLGDLRIWMKALASGELLSPEMHAEQLNFAAPNTQNYGLGVMNGGKLLGHSGEVLGYNSSMYYIPSLDATCVVLTGRYPSEIEGASDQIMLSLIQAMLSPSLSGYTFPEPADYGSLPWSEAFLAAHKKLSKEYAFGEWKSVDWDGLLAGFLPRIQKAEAEGDEKAYYLALHEYLFSIPDGHVSLTSKDPAVPLALAKEVAGGGFGLAAAELDDGRIIAAGLVPGGPAAAAGMTPGAEILSWNGVPVKTALDRINLGTMPYKKLTNAVGGANPPSTDEGRRLEQLRLFTRGAVGQKIEVEFKNPGSAVTLSASLAAVDDGGFSLSLVDFASRPEFSDKVDYRILPEGFGYILVRVELDFANPGYPASIYERFGEAVSSFIEAGVPGIVLDLRGNYGGSDELAADICGFFYESPAFYEIQEFYDGRDGRFLPLTISERNPEMAMENLMINPQDPYFSGPVAVLVNPQTKSSGEGIPMGISRLPQGKVIGFGGTNGSFGMAGGQIRLPGGYGIAYPFGRSVDAEGVVQLDSRMGLGGVAPGLRVPKTYENVMAFASGVDVELEYAIRYLSGQ